MRHGDTDWARVRHCVGWGADVAPLTELGCKQVVNKLTEISTWKPTAILSSPMPRALESAFIVGQRLGLPVTVHFELHEWIPKLTMDWRGIAEVNRLQNELLSCGGEWPGGETREWEPISRVRSRALSVLSQYRSGERLLVVAHGVLMYSLTQKWNIANCETLAFDLSEDDKSEQKTASQVA